MGQINFQASLIAVLVFLLCVPVISGASPKKEESVDIVIQGMVKIYGNEPHTWVGIETVPDGKIFFVEPPEKAKELGSLQGRLIEFTVVIYDTTRPGLEGTATVLSWRVVR